VYVADFLIDELSQNAASAEDTKQRLRRYVRTLGDALSSRDNGQMEGGVGVETPAGRSAAPHLADKRKLIPDSATPQEQKKRKSKQHATGADEYTHDARVAVLPSSDEERPAPATKGNKKEKKEQAKPRKVNAFNAFITYGKNCVPAAVQEYMKRHIASSETMMLLQRYRKFVSEEQFQQFKQTYQQVLDDFNANPERKRGDMAELIKMMKDHDTEAGISVHPAFQSLKDFVTKESKRLAAGAAKGEHVAGKEKKEKAKPEQNAELSPAAPVNAQSASEESSEESDSESE
jgi:hypothetical protein